MEIPPLLKRVDREFDLGDLAYSPSGGRSKQIFVGCVLAAALLGYSLWCLWRGEALLFGRRGDDVLLHGEPARWLAAFYGGIALFMHFHWFWGLTSAWRISEVGKTFGCLIAIAGLGRTMWLMFFY